MGGGGVMALAKNLSHLPSPAKTRDDGCPPDPQPRFAHLLAEAWAERDTTAGERPRAKANARFRHSDAGGCSRAIAYAALGVPQSNPMDLSGTFTVGLGTMVHDAWQAALMDRYPDAHVEVKVGSGERAGHIDAIVRQEIEPLLGTDPVPWVTAIEGKTIGGFAYKLAIGERGAAQGPKHAHLVQAALNAAEIDADEAVVAYWSKESVSVQAAARKGIDELTRFCAEWSFSREQYTPIAEAEQARVDSILALLDDGQLPARKYPDPELPKGHLIIDPKAGRWELADAEGNVIDTGTWWACGYCRWRDTCAKTPAGRARVSTLVEIGATPRLEVVR